MLEYSKTLLLLCLCFSMVQAQCGAGCANCNALIPQCVECSRGYFLGGGYCSMSIFRVDFRFYLIN